MVNKWEAMLAIAQKDLDALKRAEESYGNSWRRRGGVGAFMMLARKFDRIEHQCEKHGWDIFEAGEAFKGETGFEPTESEYMVWDISNYPTLPATFVSTGGSGTNWHFCLTSGA